MHMLHISLQINILSFTNITENYINFTGNLEKKKFRKTHLPNILFFCNTHLNSILIYFLPVFPQSF